MKTMTKQCILICALLFGLWSCTKERKDTQDSNAKIISAEAPCDGTQIRGRDYEKEAPIAKYQIAKYQEKYYGLISNKNANANFLSKGAKVEDINELYELVCHMRNTGGQLYIMNAITQDTLKGGGIRDVTDMIFVVVPESNSNAKSDSDPNIYLNFTQPCPAACPIIEQID